MRYSYVKMKNFFKVNEINTSQNSTMPVNNNNNVEGNKRIRNNSNNSNRLENSNNIFPSSSSTPNRIRIKRKAGPLDSDSLNVWKYNFFLIFFNNFIGSAEGFFQIQKTAFQILRLFAQIFRICQILTMKMNQIL